MTHVSSKAKASCTKIQSNHCAYTWTNVTILSLVPWPLLDVVTGVRVCHMTQHTGRLALKRWHSAAKFSASRSFSASGPQGLSCSTTEAPALCSHHLQAIWSTQSSSRWAPVNSLSVWNVFPRPSCPTLSLAYSNWFFLFKLYTVNSYSILYPTT